MRPRVVEVRRQFLSRFRPEERTENGVARFYEWLKANCPELLLATLRCGPYEQLKTDLGGLYK